MNIIIKELERCKLDVSCMLESDIIESKKTDIINKLKERKVSGFRQGKATDEAVKVKFKKEIDEELKGALSNEAYSNFLSEKNIKPFGNPTLVNITLTPNNFSCNFVIHTFPDFTLGTYKGF